MTIRKALKNKITQLRRSQPIEELKRKSKKAMRIKQKLWTVEEIDYAKAMGKIWYERFNSTNSDSKPEDKTA